jgi:hypothetical protein
MTFVRGTDERTVLAGLGVDPDDAIRPDDPEFSSTPGITIVRSGGWLVALETAAWPRGIRPDVLLRLSAGTEVVVVYEDIGKGNHEFAHAVDGEVITAVTTTAPPSWGGTQPDRLRPLAEELGMQHQDGSPGSDYYDLGGLAPLLLIAEVALGLSLDEADLNRPLVKVADEPADPTPRPRADAPPAPLVSSGHLRPHVQSLLDSGITADAIAVQAGPALSTSAVNVLLGEANFWVPAKIAEQMLAVEVPPAGRTSPSVKIPDKPPASRPPATAPPGVMHSEQIRSHVQRLIDGGVTAYTIATRIGHPNPTMINHLLRGADFWLGFELAEQILAMEVPDESASTTPVAVRSAQVRPHVQRLIDGGVTPEAIAARAGLQMTKNGTMNALIHGGHTWILATTAERILAIEVPPNT